MFSYMLNYVLYNYITKANRWYDDLNSTNPVMRFLLFIGCFIPIDIAMTSDNIILSSIGLSVIFLAILMRVWWLYLRRI